MSSINRLRGSLVRPGAAQSVAGGLKDAKDPTITAPRRSRTWRVGLAGLVAILVLALVVGLAVGRRGAVVKGRFSYLLSSITVWAPQLKTMLQHPAAACRISSCR